MHDLNCSESVRLPVSAAPERVEKLPVCVVVPVRNEAANLPRCLGALQRFAEVVVIDSNSTDSSAEIARSHGARVVDFQWNGRFPKKRNWFLMNFEHTQPWVLFIDADEVVGEDFCDALLPALKEESLDGYWINYKNHFLGKRLKFGLRQRKLALFRIGKGLYERIAEENWTPLDMEVHEHPIIEGNVGEIDVPVEHYGHRDLDKFIARHREYALWEVRRYAWLRSGRNPAWETLTRRQRFKYTNVAKWWYPWSFFVYSFLVKRGFLDGAAGFYYAYYKTWYYLSIRLMLKDEER